MGKKHVGTIVVKIHLPIRDVQVSTAFIEGLKDRADDVCRLAYFGGMDSLVRENRLRRTQGFHPLKRLLARHLMRTDGAKHDP
jgi:hypothetical protein